MEFLILNLENLLVLVWPLIVFQVLDGVGINIVIRINVFLLFGSLLLFFLSAYQILAFDVERILTTKLEFEKLDKLKLISLPADSMLMLKLAYNVFIFALQKIFFNIMGYWICPLRKW